MTTKKTEITLDAAEEAISYIPSEDRATWVRIGKALWDEFGDAAFGAWDRWSQKADSYKEASAKSVWKSVGKMSTGKKAVTIATVVYEAKRCGWKQKAAHAARRTAEESAALEAARQQRREEAARAEAEAYAAAAAKARQIWGAARPCDGHPYLTRKGISGTGLRIAAQWIREGVNGDTGEVFSRTYHDALLVPIWSAPGRLSSLQAIFPSKVIGRAPAPGQPDERRDKDYLTDGRKQGCYAPLGKITPETPVILICEGYATGATLHDVTRLPVMVAFDAGNLEDVAQMLRDKLPGTKIVVCADNDQFTVNKRTGKPWNPGLEAAMAAVNAVGGVLAMPQFASLDGKPTDWNDLAQREGAEVVAARMDAILNPKEEPKPAAPAVDDVESNAYFTVLGYDHDAYFIFQHERRQISVYRKGDFNESGFIELAPLNWWELNFPGDKGGIDRSMAANWLIRLAGARGIYDLSRIRGRGAWVDDGRTVFHHGDSLTVDGVPTQVTKIASRYVYELDRSLPQPAAEALTSDEGEYLLDMASRFRWSTPASGPLLMGWVALAPLCGALKWRPHIWLTGGAGCGKSTVLNSFVHPLMAGHDVFAQGSSSEAGIRQTLKADALPVLFDESEQNDDRERSRVQGVLALIRQASTESQALTLKGTAGGASMAFHIRSMFALASIQVGIQHQADVERMAVLSLRPKHDDPDAAETWNMIKAGLRDLAKDVTLPLRLLRRSLDLLPVTLQNITVFGDAATNIFGSVRDGDQYGTLMAGAWSLLSDRVATPEEALEMIQRYDWSEHRDQADTDESERALAALLESHIRMQGGAEVTVYELVRSACGFVNPGLDVKDVAADAVLQRYGMRIQRREGIPRLMLANGSLELKRMMSGSPFAADLRGMLLRLPDADRGDNRPARFNGSLSKWISVPLAGVLEGAMPAANADKF